MGFKLEKKERRGEKPVFSSEEGNVRRHRKAEWGKAVEWGERVGSEQGVPRTKHFKVRILWKKGNCAYKRKHSFSWETFNLAVQLNADRESSPVIYLHPCYTRVYTAAFTSVLARYKFSETIADIADQRSRISNKAIRKECTRVLSVNVGRNGKYSTGTPNK